MAFKIIIFIFLSSVLTACSDMEQSRRYRERPDRFDRSGAIASSFACQQYLKEDQEEGSRGVENMETVSFVNWLKNCRTGVTTTDNTIDMLTQSVGWQDKYAPGRFRECLRCKLADVHSKICSQRDELERQRQSANSDADRIRIENNIARLDELQYNFSQRLYKEANKYDEAAQKLHNRESKTFFDRALNWIGRQEAEALRDILNAESYNECNNFNYDDADDYRYEDDYRRNDSYRRRRSY